MQSPFAILPRWRPRQIKRVLVSDQRVLCCSFYQHR